MSICFSDSPSLCFILFCCYSAACVTVRIFSQLEFLAPRVENKYTTCTGGTAFAYAGPIHPGTRCLTISRTLIFPFKLSNVILRHSSFSHTSTFSTFEVSYKTRYINSLLLLLLFIIICRFIYKCVQEQKQCRSTGSDIRACLPGISSASDSCVRPPLQLGRRSR